ncbi:hypothetical protein JQ633_27540 [Bradyrhizobium tropiciagri]|uniref:hypothetical protein n=1 Tax=Bradyrhizobium tropiciagri TaxID=312253 RepID=UPI001BA9CF2D|nr:hypothetical protein [Bradyrhizobium tropiciagri]MBR0874142.1 hypothetical protein [Bradyrhizobium tropiciagri]
MSQMQKGILGVLALGATLGAVQLASGHDLIGGQQVATTPAVESAVNRAAKADRATVPSAAAKSQTFAMKFDGLPDTSVLVRVPATREATKNEARNRPVAPARARPGDGRKVACEPVVSVLTDVAKLLQPGRCIT